MATAGRIDIFLNANLKNFQEGISSGIAGIKNFTKGFADIAGAVFVFKGAIDTATQFVGKLVDQVGKLDEIGDVAARFDITATAVQKLRRTIQLSGADIGSLDTLLGKLAVNLGDAAGGRGSAVGALRSLGLSAADLQGMSLDESFRKIAESVSKIPDPTRRAAVATDIFGRSATEMMEVFTRQGVFEEASKDIDRFAAKLDEVSVDSVGKAAESVERLSLAWEGLKDEVAINAAPTLASASEFLASFLASLRDPEQRGQFVRDYIIAPDESWREKAVANQRPAGSSWLSRTYGKVPLIREAAPLIDPDTARISNQISTMFRDFDELQNFAFRRPGVNYGSTVPLPPGGLPDLRQMFMGGNPDFTQATPNFSLPSGAGALEAGSIAAYSAIQRAQRDDEAKRLTRQQLEEQRKTTKKLDEIFQVIEQGFDVATVGLQG